MRAMTALLVVLVVLVVLVGSLGHEIERHIRVVEAWTAELGVWGPVAFAILLAVSTSVLIPESLFGIAAGTLFGLGHGFLVTLAGNLLAAALQYGLSHRLLRSRIERSVAGKPELEAIRDAVLDRELGLQALLRLTPLNHATISYLLGAAGVGFGGFMLASLAQIPHLFVEVYVGYAGRHIARMVGGGAVGARLGDLILFGGLAAGLLALVWVWRVSYRAMLRAVEEEEEEHGIRRRDV